MATTLNLDIAQELDITVRKGDNFSFTVTVKDSNGDAVDISPGNYTFNIDVRTSTDRSSRDNVVLSSAGIPGGLTATGAADGTLTIEGGVIAMDAVQEGSYVYDIQSFKAATSFYQTWFFGQFTVNADITDYDA
tara:strand:+ start:552 stop:953 length:402 start_codon:yes stop_codon:yes gene_type:complete